MAYKLQTLRSGATQHPEQMIDYFAVAMISDSGVVNKDGGDLKVTPDLTALRAIVAQGAAFLRKDDGSMVYPVVLSIEDAEVTVDSNPSGNPRIDAVVIFQDLNETPNTTATNVAKFKVVKGSPAASPQAPGSAAIEAEIGSNPYVHLANVRINSGAATITEVADMRHRFGIAPQFDDADVGDVVSSFASSKRGRWILANGASIGNENSGAVHAGEEFRDLYYLMVDTYGGNKANFDNGSAYATPDLRSRMVRGAANQSVVGNYGGTDSISVSNHSHSTGSHTLTEGQMPAHNHSGTTSSVGNHSHTGLTSTTGNHSHALSTQLIRSGFPGGGYQGGSVVFGTGAQNTLSAGNHNHSFTTNSAGAHNHTFTTSTRGSNQSHNHGNTGSGGGFSTSIINRHVSLNFFMKY